jgi:uncharacterized membrane protein (DUF485 family)
MGLIRKIGMTILIISLLIWIIYIMFIFIPTFQADINNTEIVGKGLIFTLIIGGFATLGGILTKG